MMDHGGNAYVVKAADSFELLHKTPMSAERAQFTRSTVAIAQRNLFIRTNEKLFCIGRN